jgi:hypothetical protein
MTPADLSSLADDLEKRCENVDQLDFLVTFLAWISDNHDNLTVNDFEALADHCYEISDRLHCGIPTPSYDEEVADAVTTLHAMLGAKYCKAVGRA